jgi:transcriptional regulator with XRE-family HTH domain
MDRTTMTIFANAVRLYRESYGIGQQELAARVGIKQGSFSRFESGKLQLSSDTYNKVVNELHKLIGERKTLLAMADQLFRPFGPTTPVPTPPTFPPLTVLTEADYDAIDKEASELQLEELRQRYKALLATTRQHNMTIKDLTEAGYAILPLAFEHERDQLKAQLAEMEQSNQKLRQQIAANEGKMNAQ